MEQQNKQSFVEIMRPYSDRFNSKLVVVHSKGEIKGRGSTWVLDVKSSGLPLVHKYQLSMMGHLIKETEDGDVYEIIGIENDLIPDSEREYEYMHVLVKPRK